MTPGLKWVRVNIPQYRVPGEMAQLQCDYDLGNDTLYSVKWYKEHEEFYRYVPKAHPQANSYKVDGVHVDVSLCTFQTSKGHLTQKLLRRKKIPLFNLRMSGHSAV